jgi:hypothetical protein
MNSGDSDLNAKSKVFTIWPFTEKLGQVLPLTFPIQFSHCLFAVAFFCRRK